MKHNSKRPGAPNGHPGTGKETPMESDIIVVSDHIEIHPTRSGGKWAVVRDGSVYGTYPDLQQAKELAEDLATKLTCVQCGADTTGNGELCAKCAGEE